MKGIIISLACLFSTFALMAQRNVKDSVLTSTQIGAGYAYQFPFGDMDVRYGANHNLGVSIYYKTKNNWFVGAEGGFVFGRNVSEPGLMQNLITRGGEIIDDNGSLAEVHIEERGWTVTVGGGKLFNIIGPNPNSGLVIRGGIGFMQHKIRLEHQLNPISQLEDEYLLGYDRLTNGLALTQFVGYLHSGNSRLLNFYVGIEATEAFTRGRRDIYFDTQEVDNAPRFDGLLGFRAGWILHVYKRMPETYYLY
jgi:hypothetical protein